MWGQTSTRRRSYLFIKIKIFRGICDVDTVKIEKTFEQICAKRDIQVAMPVLVKKFWSFYYGRFATI